MQYNKFSRLSWVKSVMQHSLLIHTLCSFHYRHLDDIIVNLLCCLFAYRAVTAFSASCKKCMQELFKISSEKYIIEKKKFNYFKNKIDTKQTERLLFFNFYSSRDHLLLTVRYTCSLHNRELRKY